MADIPKSILNKLRCSQCEGYLSIAPVMVTTAGVQICGRCFKILPMDEQRRYVREVGLEALAEMLMFPCRYHQQGCTFEMFFNNGEDHERECPHRHILHYSNQQADDKNDRVDSCRPLSVQCQTKELQLESNYSLKQNRQNKNNAVLKYTIDIGACSGYALCLQSEQYLKPVEIKVEGAIALKNTPESIYCEVNTKGMLKTTTAAAVEHVYESINSRPGSVRKCNNCCNTIVNEAFYCPYGHYFCRKCRETACLHCTSYVSNTPRYACENYVQGCRETLVPFDVRKHQTECEFNIFQCPVAQCDWHGILKTTKLHILERHVDKVVESAEISKKSTASDDAWLMCAYESMFKCKYFYYENFVEFLVIYIGSHDKARRFKYDIEVPFNYKTLRRSAVCIGWNGFSLEAGIAIQNAEILELTRNKQSCKDGFNFTLKISEFKESSYL